MFPYGKMPRKGVFKPYHTITYPTPLIYMFLFFLQVSKEGAQSIQVFPIHKWSLKFDQGESMIGKGN